MDFSLLIGPAIVAAVISAFVTATGIIVSSRTANKIHKERLDFDKAIAQRKFDFDTALAERKFNFDIELSNRKRRIELAEETLAECYRIKDSIRAIRSPMSYEHESKSREKDSGESEGTSRLKDAYYAPLSRLDARNETIAPFMARRYRMKAAFGTAAEKPFDLIHDILTEIQVSAQMLIMSINDEPQEAADRELRKKWKQSIWWAGEDGEIEAKINLAISEMENICRPVLEAKQTSTV